jgi:hypothetical protein
MLRVETAVASLTACEVCPNARFAQVAEVFRELVAGPKSQRARRPGPRAMGVLASRTNLKIE